MTGRAWRLTASLALAGSALVAPHASAAITATVLSSMPQLVTGEDALVRISGATAAPTVTVGTKDVSAAFSKDANGNYVSSLTSFASLRYTTVGCDAFTAYSPDVLTEEAVATGGTVLRYDSNQFIYNWKTPSTPNVCYILILTLDDGTTHLADFKLKK